MVKILKLFQNGSNYIFLNHEYCDLAYLDYNHHLGRSQLEMKDGKHVYTRTWGRHTARWHIMVIPVSKSYAYMPGIGGITCYCDTSLHGVYRIDCEVPEQKTLGC